MNVILHLGLGSFHRAHQAVYLQQLIDAGDRSWTLAGGNLRPDNADTIAALQRQGGQYTLETVAPDGKRQYQKISSITSVVPYQSGLAPLIQIGANANTRIVSFTVTEAGYYLDADHRLNLAHADLAADIERASESGAQKPNEGTNERTGESTRASGAGVTIYGALTAILRARMRAQAGKLTLLNCDNLRQNGKRSRSGLLQYIALIGDPQLAQWVEANTTSPNAMVDRITPRPAPDVRARVKLATGIDDEAALMGESFIQWVIEDSFCNGRPAWERVGTQLVATVEPYEEAKIRILNASHSCIAWAGTLVGYEFIHQGTHDARIRQFAHDYVTNDVMPCLTPSPLDLAAYRDVVLDRFGNEAIRDTNQRVAMDGFSKIPGFIAPTIRERLAHAESIASVAILPVLFLSFLKRWHHGQLPYEYQDQSMDQAAAHAICAASDPIQAFCASTVLWGAQAGDARLTTALRQAHSQVLSFLAGHDA